MFLEDCMNMVKNLSGKIASGLAYSLIVGGLIYSSGKDMNKLEYTPEEFCRENKFKEELKIVLTQNEEKMKTLQFKKEFYNLQNPYTQKIDSINKEIEKDKNTLELLTEKYSRDVKIRNKSGLKLLLGAIAMFLSPIFISIVWDDEE